MASVYILYSPASDLFYIGSTQNIEVRLDLHFTKEFKNSFTAKYQDWNLFFSISDISNTCARKIESHIKKMKSRVYLNNLVKHPEISQKLIKKYK